MKIYLAHETADDALAAQVEAALKGAGHQIYRRSGMLEAGKGVTDSVRRSIGKSDFLVFVASPASTAQGTLSLSDLVMAHEKWRDPKGRILVLHTKEHALAPGDTRLNAFPAAGPIQSPDQIVELVSSQYGLRRDQTRWLGRAAALAAFVIALGGAAYFFTQSGTTQFAEPAGDVEFEPDVDYSDNIDLGETRHFPIRQTAGSEFPFKCKAGPSPSSNIKSVTHDEKCTDVVVTAIDGPFTDANGTPYQLGYSYPERDQVPVVIETMSGKEVYRTSIQFRVSNGGSGYLLQGMDTLFDPMSLMPHFVVTPGKRYDIEILTPAGMPIPDQFECGPNRQYSSSSYSPTFTGGCKFTLANAQPGKLVVNLKRSSPPYQIDLFFDLVDDGWQATPPSEFVGVTNQEWLDGHLRDKKRIESWIKWREADRANGVAHAQNDWFLNYLKQALQVVDDQIERDKTKLGQN